MNERSIRQYRWYTLVLGLSVPIYLISFFLLVVSLIVTLWIENDFWGEVARFVIAIMIPVMYHIIMWTTEKTKSTVSQLVYIVLFRPFRPQYSKLAKTLITPLLSRFGDLFTVFSDGFPNSAKYTANGVHYTTNNFENLFATEGEHYGDEFEIREDGPIIFGWKDSVFGKLIDLDIVVIDVSDGASGLKWEIELADSLLPSERLIFIAKRSNSPAYQKKVIDRLSKHGGIGTEHSDVLYYSSGLWDKITFFFRLRKRMLSAIMTPQWLEAKSQRDIITAALAANGDVDLDTLETQLGLLFDELGESRDRVWWYIRHSVIEGDSRGLYWLNLRLPKEIGPEGWQKLSTKKRYKLMIDLINEIFSNKKSFKEGIRAWKPRYQRLPRQ